MIFDLRHDFFFDLILAGQAADIAQNILDPLRKNGPVEFFIAREQISLIVPLLEKTGRCRALPGHSRLHPMFKIEAHGTDQPVIIGQLSLNVPSHPEDRIAEMDIAEALEKILYMSVLIFLMKFIRVGSHQSPAGLPHRRFRLAS